MVRELFQYQAHADAAMVVAIGRHAPAADDEELRRLLSHMLVAHRFWVHLCQGIPFSGEAERNASDSLGEIAARFESTQREELAWLDQLEDTDLERLLETERLPGRHIAVGEALLQVCLHSQGHRAQCATRLRALGGAPPPTDYILWAKDRLAPAWI